MRERLSDEFLAQMDGFAADMMDGVESPAVDRVIHGAMVSALVAESRALRAQDLTSDEVEDLTILRDHLRLVLQHSELVHREWKATSLAVLERLTKEHGK
jgi:hypothetical protein